MPSPDHGLSKILTVEPNAGNKPPVAVSPPGWEHFEPRCLSDKALSISPRRRAAPVFQRASRVRANIRRVQILNPQPLCA
jgi:hypothetical protein